jgi:hypothetical protein
MNETTTKLIEQLAEKLGTTVEHLFAVLVRQAPISASVYFAWSLTLFVAVVLWIRLVQKKNKEAKSDDCSVWAVDGPAYIFSWAGIVGVGFFMSFSLFSSIEDMIIAFANPEYFALIKILQLL